MLKSTSFDNMIHLCVGGKSDLSKVSFVFSLISTVRFIKQQASTAG